MICEMWFSMCKTKAYINLLLQLSKVSAIKAALSKYVQKVSFSLGYEEVSVLPIITWKPLKGS